MRVQHWIAVVVVGSALFGLGWWLGGSTATVPDNSDARPQSHDHEAEEPKLWTCPMHPQVKQPDPGKCPICGMDLVPMTSGGKDPGPRRLVMTESDKKLAEIATALVERRYVETDVRMAGMVDYDETRVRTISAWVPGRLDRLYVDFTGIRVRKGDHLVWLYSPEILTAQEELLEAKRAVTDAVKERSEFLRDSNRRALESARDKLRLWGLTDTQVAEIEERGTAVDHIMIPSPGAGIVTHKALNEGAYVQTGTPIYKIAELDHLWIQLDAYESDLPWIRYGQDVAIETEALPGEVFRGPISFIAPELDHRTRTVKVRVNVANPDEKLKPGMFVRAVVRARIAQGGKVMEPKLAGKWICPMHPEVVEDEQTPCRVCGMKLVRAEDLGYVPTSSPATKPLVVPVTAVLWTGQRAVVYVAVPGKEKPTYEGREVVLGPRAGDHYIVFSGLEGGERVVVNGAFKIDSALQILAKPSMMTMKGTDPVKARIPASFRQSLAPTFGAYFEIADALASDDEPRARRAFAAFGRVFGAVQALGLPAPAHSAWLTEADVLAEAVVRAASAAGIGGLRTEFHAVSKAMLQIENTIGHSGVAPHFQMYCPMAFDGKGGAWLQRDDKVRNPYYGAAMLACGSVQEVHAGSGQGSGVPAKESGNEQPPKEQSPDKEAKASSSRAAAVALGPVYDAYLLAQSSLAGDRFDAAKKSFVGLDAAVGAVDMKVFRGDEHVRWMTLAKQLRAAAKEGAAAQDVASCRVAFKRASEAALALVTEIGHARNGKLYEHFCPMAFGNKGGAWIQTDDKLRNPYYGAAMLHCGVMKRTFSSVDERR